MVEPYSASILNKVGEGARVLAALRDAGVNRNLTRSKISSSAKFSCPCMEIGVPCIERFFLGSEIALEIRFTFGNDAPTVGIFIERNGRYFCAVAIAQNGFVCRH